MKLFIIDNEDVYTAWKNWVNVQWVAGNTPSFVMNGLRSNNFWGLFTSPTTALYGGLTFGADKVSGQACLEIERDSTRSFFTAFAVTCSNAKHFFCEFVDK